MEPLNLDLYFDDEDGLTRVQQENIVLLEMFDSALAELSEKMNDCPTDRQIFDHLFKGRRQYKDVRAIESRMIDLIEDERAHFLNQLIEAQKTLQ